MKKKQLVIALLACLPILSKGQQTDSSYQKTTVNQTEIEVLYSHYNQNGNNSAVTGGIGTEKLTVYAPSVNVKNTHNNRSRLSIHAGLDVISSASTDRIDFAISSASAVDRRFHTNLNYSRRLGKQNTWVGAGTGFSMESDYFSRPVNVNFEHTDKVKMRSYSAEIQMFFDDLRWGRVNPNYYRPVKLIYPKELRTKDWYDDYLRQSYTLKLGFSQVLNRRNILGIYPELALQNGLLATPFHRIYFADSTKAVEFLPDQRLKLALGIKENSFIGGRTILKSAVDLYIDNFGMASAALETEFAVKLSSQWVISPFGRVYWQTASKYFAPYAVHLSSEQFYTSDYDLSKFYALKLGIGIRYSPNKYLRKNLMFSEIQLRYAYYYRSTPLNAHIITCTLNLGRTKSKVK